MTIEVRLFATLRKYLPPGSGRTSAQVQMEPGARVANVLEQLDIPPAKAALVLINGHYEADRDRPLEEGWTVSVFPAIAGG